MKNITEQLLQKSFTAALAYLIEQANGSTFSEANKKEMANTIEFYARHGEDNYWWVDMERWEGMKTNHHYACRNSFNRYGPAGWEKNEMIKFYDSAEKFEGSLTSTLRKLRKASRDGATVRVLVK